MKFKSIKQYSFEELYESKSTFAIQTLNGSMYDECELLFSVGYGGVRQFHFKTSGVTIEGINVKSIAFEDPSLDPKGDDKTDTSVLKIYSLHLGWRGSVICTAYSLEEATKIILDNRAYLEDKDLENIQVHPIDGFLHVNYGDE